MSSKLRTVEDLERLIDSQPVGRGGPSGPRFRGKPCAICDHPERPLIEEALVGGVPYRELQGRFSVPLGAMRRHRKGNMHPTPTPAPFTSEEVYLRMGVLPLGGISETGFYSGYEDGVSVYEARTTPDGYVLRFPRSAWFLAPIGSTVSRMLQGRSLYVAHGTRVGSGTDGEPLLKNAELQPASIFARLDLPDWLGEEGRTFADGWNRWRASGCPRETSPDGATRPLSRYLEHDAWRLMLKIDDVLGRELEIENGLSWDERAKLYWGYLRPIPSGVVSRLEGSAA